MSDLGANVTECLDIVKQLAERGPFIYYGDDDDAICSDCDVPDLFSNHVQEPANHEPWCLWRRARELYPTTPATPRSRR